MKKESEQTGQRKRPVKRKTKQLTEQERTKRSKALFLKNLLSCHGIIKDAAAKTKISRTTVKTWKDTDPDFKKACEDVDEDVLDFVEGTVLKGIKRESRPRFKGKPESSMWYLDRKGRARGYGKSVEVSGGVNVGLRGKTLEELEEMEKNLDRLDQNAKEGQ